MRYRLTAVSAVFLLSTSVLAFSPRTSPDATAQSTFVDIAGNTHETNIIAIADAGITAGCDSAGTRYCPQDAVTRGQMATFLTRALGLSTTSGDLIGGSVAAGTDGFSYADDPFAASGVPTGWPAYADGNRSGGELAVTLGGIDGNDLFGLAGGWQRSFSAGSGDVELSITYNLSQSAAYEPSEAAYLLIQIDGSRLGGGGYVDAVSSPSDDTTEVTTGWQTYTTTLTPGEGNHTITVGAYNEAKSTSDEVTTLRISDISLSGEGAAATFSDVSGVHADAIAAVAAAGITLGCDATGTRFCPNDFVTRAQMASFMTRALDLSPAANPFSDVSGVHAENIGAVAAAGITAGCNANGTLYCPNNDVKRDQMASFLARALDLTPDPDPDPDPNPGDPDVSVSPGSLDFGSRDVDAGASTAQFANITNNGNGSLVVESITLGGSHPADFSVVSDTGETTLGSGQTRVVGIVFDPTATNPSTRSATLNVGTDAGDGTASLTGTATGTVSGNNPPALIWPGIQTNDLDDSVNLQISGSDADGDSITYSASGLPTGLSISSGGLITGTTGTSGTWSPTVTGTDGTDDDSVTFTWTVNGVDPPAGFDLSMDRFYISQSVPAIDSDESDQVEVITGRDGLVRAFVSASESNDAAPTVTLFWQTGSDSGSVILAGPGAVPTSPSEGTLGDTFTTLLDGSLITSDLEVYVEVDPNDTIAESNESNNRYPSSGWLDVGAVSVPQLSVTLVPITFDGTTPNITDPAAYLDDTLRMLPVAGYDVTVRSTPMIAGGSSFNWSSELDNLYTLRSTDGSSRMYHGIVDPGYSSGVAGIGYIGAPVAISWNNSGADGVIAHELGHNFSLDHAPCGVSGDPNFPYSDGSTGVWGYDIFAGTLESPSSNYDLMSYCGPNWISDYHYQKALDFRQSAGYFIAGDTLSGSQTTLVISGRVDGDTVTVDPLFTFDVDPTPPTPGDHRAIGYDASGSELFSVDFTVHEMHIWDDHQELPSGFTFGLAIDDAAAAALDRVDIVRDGDVVSTREAGDIGEMSLAIDSVTGLVTRVIRDGSASNATVLHSDGLRTVR